LKKQNNNPIKERTYIMGLLKDWRDHAYGLDDRTPEGKQFWLNYFQIEKGIYEILLKEPKTVVKGTVKELAEKYNTTIEIMVGFLDGIDESLKQPNNLDEITEDSEVTIDIDTEKLYMNMVGCNAEWLYTLPEWDNIYDKETRDALYKKEKTSHTVVKAPKVGRNDPCPCGSGKKYKKCCGK
jgi:Predicted metal-binding protein related to the C-terminal domain of SecA